MDETPQFSWREWMIRRAPIIGAAAGSVLTLTIGVLYGAGVKVPILIYLLYPAAILTWLFIYGDNGTELQSVVATIKIALVINAILGGLLGVLVRIAIRRHFQVSLKAVMASTFWFCAALAVGASSYWNSPVWWPQVILIGALVGAGVGTLGSRTLAGTACGIILCIAAPYLWYGLFAMGDAWFEWRRAWGWR